MSVVKPAIDDLLEKTDHNRFLLSSLASQRASDINNMLRGQHSRVLAAQDTDDLTVMLSGKDTISMAMEAWAAELRRCCRPDAPYGLRPRRTWRSG